VRPAANKGPQPPPPPARTPADRGTETTHPPRPTRAGARAPALGAAPPAVRGGDDKAPPPSLPNTPISSRHSRALMPLVSRVTASPASIRLLAFSRVGEPLEVAVAGPDGKPFAKEPLALPTQQLSPARTVPSRTLVFTAPKDLKTVLGKVTLPATEREFILVFLPAAKDSAQPYQVQAIPLPAAGFGSGDQAFVNFSGRQVGCVIDGERLSVPHGKAAVYQAAKSGKGAGNRTIVCYAQKDGKWEDTPFFSSRLIIQDGVRNLILICLSPTTGEIDFRGVADFVGG